MTVVRNSLQAGVFLVFVLVTTPARADDFERLEGEILTNITRAGEPLPQPSIGMPELARIPRVLRDTRATLLIVRTDLGNVARVLIDFGLRQPEGAEAVPILILDRFDTFETGASGDRLARGRGLQLFDGFRLDLDTGQVVPEGHGGDLRFEAKADGGPLLWFEGDAKAYVLTRSPFATDAATTGPSPGRAVVPADFRGRYHLAIGGQWSGPLDLEVDDQAQVTGRFRSNETGSSYRVAGQVSRVPPNQIDLVIRFPRSELTLSGWLFADGKAAFAGSASFLERPIGFYALREGAALDENRP